MKYRFRATEVLDELLPAYAPAEGIMPECLADLKENPFDSRLRSHKIHRLSARYGKTIYAATIEDDLRLLFYLEGETITSLIVGNPRYIRGLNCGMNEGKLIPDLIRSTVLSMV